MNIREEIHADRAAHGKGFLSPFHKHTKGAAFPRLP